MTRLLIRMPNHLGDIVMATPVLEEVRKRWPQATVTALCKDVWLPLLEHHPHLDALLPLSSTPLSSLQYDIGLLLPNSFSSAWMFYRAGIKQRIGYRGDWRAWLLTEPFSRPRQQQHLVETYKHLVGAAHSPATPTLHVTSQEKKGARTSLRRLGVPKGALCVGIHPTAAYGPTKCWLPERFRELMRRFPSVYFLVFSDQTGAAIVHNICQGLPTSVLNLAGKTTLRELMALITCCHACVTNDSGPMHIAAALNIPLIALFGSTNAHVTGPYRHGTIIDKHVACAPCYRRHCPIDFRCMTTITVDEVEHTLRSLLYMVLP